jgi:hypothetical protein
MPFFGQRHGILDGIEGMLNAGISLDIAKKLTNESVLAPI